MIIDTQIPKIKLYCFSVYDVTTSTKKNQILFISACRDVT